MKMVKEGDRIQRNGKTYIVLRRKYGHVNNYYLFTPEEVKVADGRFRKYYEYK